MCPSAHPSPIAGLGPAEGGSRASQDGVSLHPFEDSSRAQKSRRPGENVSPFLYSEAKAQTHRFASLPGFNRMPR